MRVVLAIVVFFLAALSVIAQDYVAPTLKPIERSISTSKQFFIYYPDKTVRGHLASDLEEIKKEWLDDLELPDDWKNPIVLRLMTLRPSDTPPFVTTAFEGDDGQFKIQIDAYELSMLRSADFQIEVLRALCLEFEYRDHPIRAGKPVVQPPAWLLEGLYERLAAKEDASEAGLCEMLITKGSLPKLDVFLKQDPDLLDTTSRAIYRVQSMAFLRGLLSLPNGAKHLSGYLSGLPEGNPQDPKLLLAAFPEIRSDPAQLSKVWALSLAAASNKDSLQYLGFEESCKQLSTLLDATAPKDPKKPDEKPLEGAAALPAVARGETGKYLMRQKSTDLLRLEVHAHPLLRPIIQEYRLITSLLASKPRKNVTERLKENGELFAALAKRGSDVEDYLNWYEAARLNIPSGKFAAAVSSPQLATPPRNDAISRALDTYESRGW